MKPDIIEATQLFESSVCVNLPLIKVNSKEHYVYLKQKWNDSYERKMRESILQLYSW